MALNAIRSLSQLTEDPAQAATMLRQHKIDRPYLGTATATIDAGRSWRETLSLMTGITLARDL
jgi:hypothetical protein